MPNLKQALQREFADCETRPNMLLGVMPWLSETNMTDPFSLRLSIGKHARVSANGAAKLTRNNIEPIVQFFVGERL